MIDELNAQYAISKFLSFEKHSSGLVIGKVLTPACRGTFFLHGAHVASFIPTGQSSDVLFMSKNSMFEAGKPIRGGVPICFPWFGPKAGDSTAPAHGLARLQAWSIESTTYEEGVVTVVLATSIQPWDIRYTVAFGSDLKLSIEVVNTGNAPATYECALHTYFTVGESSEVSITGLEQQAFLDKVAGGEKEATGEAIRFTGETDRVYHGPVAQIALHDHRLSRSIYVTPEKSNSSVIWNPWVEKSIRMPDFGDNEYPNMCCIETANVGPNAVTLGPGDRSVMAAKISVNA